MKLQLPIFAIALIIFTFNVTAQQLYWTEYGTNTLTGTTNDYIPAIEKAVVTNLSTNTTDWFESSGKYPQQTVTVEPALSLTGYPDTGTGKSLRFMTKDPGGFNFADNVVLHRRLGNPAGAQTLYLSFVASAFRVSAAGGLSLPIGFGEVNNDDGTPANTTAGINYRLLIKNTGTANNKAGSFQFGLSKIGGANTISTTKTYTANGNGTGDAAIFVVVKVTLDGDDTDGDDLVQLYTSTSFPASEPAVWDIEVSDGSDALINSLFIREKMDAVDDHFVDLHGIRVGDSWASLFGGSTVAVTSIGVTAENNISSVIIGENSLQFTADVLPLNATISSVTWSVVNDISSSGGQAEITASGLVTGTTKGTVRVTATAKDASGITGIFDLSVETFVDPVTSGSVSPTGVTLAVGEYELIFSDEFNDTSIDLNKWTILESTTTRGPRPEIGINEWYWKPDNIREASGNLEIDVDKFSATTMHTGAIYSNDKFELAYGYYEVSVKIPETSKGTHAAFWLQGDNMTNVDGSGRDGAEIDIFESAWTDDITKSVVHIDGYGADKQADTKQYNTPNMHDGNFHTWGFLWEPDQLTIYYDGSQSVTYTNPKFIPQVEEFLWLSTGASFGFNTPGEAADFTFTSEPIGKLTSALVDYIRVWKNSSLTPTLLTEIEAESFITGGSSFGGYDPIKSCVNASGSQVVFMQGNFESHNDRFIGFNNINITEAGIYDLKITYYTGTTNDNPIEINVNGTIITENFSNSGSGFCSTGLKTNTIPVSLQVGANTIQFSPADCTGDGSGLCTGNFTPYLDKLEIFTRASGVDVTSITVSSENDVSSLVENETLQLSTAILPELASDPSVAWSVSSNDTGAGTMGVTGLFTAGTAGTVTVTATANDGSGVTATFDLTITEPVIVTGINITTATGNSSIANFDYMQLTAEVLPANATDKSFTWSIVNGTGIASITSDGIVVPHKIGTVTATGTANDGSNISTDIVLTITTPATANLIYKTESEFGVLANSASINDNAVCNNVSGNGWAKLSDNDIAQVSLSNVYVPTNGTYQLDITYYSGDGGNPVLIDLLVNDTDFANSTEISFTAIGFCQNVPAAGVKSIVVNLIANQANEIIFRNTGALNVIEPLIDFITINKIPVTEISVSSAGGLSSIPDDQTLQFSAVVVPGEATDPAITWSVINGTGEASISQAGLLTAIEPGGVTITATSDDQPSVSGTFDLTVSDISTQTITITTGTNNAQAINGSTLQMIAGVLPTNTTNPGVNWSVSNGTGSASIDAQGLLSTSGAGTVTVTATAIDGSGIQGSLEIEIIINEILVNSITISTTENVTSIDQFEALAFAVNILPIDATNKSVSWTINDGAIATISSEGLLSALTVGAATITATANDASGLSATFDLTISTALVSAISLTTGTGSNEVIIADDLQFTANLTPANVTDPSVTWSVIDGTGSASIDQNGLLTAIGVGIVTITAAANDASTVSGSLEITVIPKLVESIVIASDQSKTSIQQFETLQFSATVLPVDATDKSVNWSVSDTNMATINSEGLLTADNVGGVTVIATANDGSGKTESFSLTINNVLITGIIVSSQSNQVFLDNTAQMIATITPEKVTNNSISWTVTNGTGMASIASNGLLTAEAVGTVIVSASANDASGISKSLEITIETAPVLVSAINIASAEGSFIEMGQTSQMSAAILPINAIDQSITWSVVGTAASISQSGLLTGNSEGSITVVATANDASGIKGTLEVTINPIVVTEIKITSALGTNLEIGQASQMSVEVLPALAADKTITWSVDGTAATIDQNGILTAVSEGLAIVVASANDGSGISGSLEIIIGNPIIQISSITLTSLDGDVFPNGKTFQMSAKILPLSSSDPSVTWSVTNGSGAGSIDQSGLFSAVTVGSITILATANDGSGITGSLEISISEPVVLVTAINVTSAGGTNIETGQTTQMLAEVLPGNANDVSITWAVVGTGASIDENGLLTTESVGIVTAMATANDGSGVTGSLEISISEPVVLVTAINVTSAGGTNIETGQTTQMLAEVLPGNANDVSITWAVVGTGASIDQNGLLTAVSAGIVTAMATAKDGSGIIGSLEITISDPVILVTAINVTSAAGMTIETGQTSQMSAEVLPGNANDVSITWAVVGTGASIDQNGLLTAVSAGIVTTMATANDGSDIIGFLEITISDPVILVTAINVTSAGGTNIETGQTTQMLAEVLPGNAADVSVTWTVVGTSASIDQNGLLTVESAGLVTVVATANDASGISGSLEVEIMLVTSVFDQQDIEAQVKVYPNPVINSFQLESGNIKIKSIELIDMKGHVVLRADHNNQPVDISKLSNGSYIIKAISTQGELYKIRIIKEQKSK